MVGAPEDESDDEDDGVLAGVVAARERVSAFSTSARGRRGVEGVAVAAGDGDTAVEEAVEEEEEDATLAADLGVRGVVGRSRRLADDERCFLT